MPGLLDYIPSQSDVQRTLADLLAGPRNRLADLMPRGLLGAARQYISDAAPGGVLNAEWTPENVRTAGEVASMMPNPAGDVISGLLAVDDLRKGDYGSAALNSLGLVPFVPALGGVTKYARRSQSAADPFNNVGYAMFVKADDPRATLDALQHYGQGKWLASERNSVPVQDIQKDILREIRKNRLHDEYQTTAAALARDAAPENIVNSAGLWDSPELVEIIYRNVLEPRGINAVRTPDGLIKFDKSGVHKVR